MLYFTILLKIERTYVTFDFWTMSHQTTPCVKLMDFHLQPLVCHSYAFVWTLSLFVFKLGPRDGHFVHWVCEVNPDSLAKLEGKSAYLGLTKCKIRLYSQVTQCYNCQGYGHIAGSCNADKPTCRHCAEAHESRTCSRKDAQAKCANCKGAHAASSKNCRARDRAAVTMTRRTDFAIRDNGQ